MFKKAAPTSTKKFQFGFPSKTPAPPTTTTPTTTAEALSPQPTHSTDEQSRKRMRIVALDDAQELLASAGIESQPAADSDQDDPLDAFMADISEQANHTKSEPK
ncbi:hypothetical protein BDF14DRAFT_253412 [Spinellus fusiger]|nr:hypothetical protein BDF14DRAFT_253412 [Spinellus fusiger]